MLYVDKLTPCVPNKNWRYKTSCHLFSDGHIVDLIAMCKKLGFPYSYIQFSKRDRFPHIDLNVSKRKQAIKPGAKECDREKLVECMKKFRKDRKGQTDEE